MPLSGDESVGAGASAPTDLVALLAWRAAHEGAAVAYTFIGSAGAPDVTWSYAELWARASATAAALRGRCRPGDRVLLLYPPGLDYIAAFFGCLAAGAIAVPAYPPLATRWVDRVMAIVADARPALALTDTATHRAMAARDDLAALVATLPMLATDTLEAPETAPTVMVLPEAAFLQYTSGSTGAPKGVVVTHANLWHNSGLIHTAFGHGPASLALGWLPPFHDMGLVGSILQPLFGGFPGVLMAPSAFLKRPLSWLQAISRFGATTSGGPNFAYDVCVSKLRPEAMEGVDLSRWRVAFNGAEPVRAATMARFAAAFAPWGFRAEAFYPCYGMAEATLIITGGRPERPACTLRVSPDALAEGRLAPSTAPDARELVSSGHVLGDQRLRVVDPRTKQPLPPGQVGEIWLSGPSVASGYWQRPDGEDFAARLAGDEGGAYMRTGDLGALWDGELVVTGRLKDVIIVDGANHYPQDLEWSAQQSHPALRADGGAAFALTDGAVEQVVLVHELQPAVSEADRDAAIAAIRAALSSQHGLACAAIVLLPPGGLPRTSSGKVRRRACRDAFLACTLGARAEWRSAAFSLPDGPRPSPV